MAAATVALAAGLLTNWPMVSVADAHANLLASSPAAGQSVGGTVDRLQLVFDEPISELVVRVDAPEGVSVEPTIGEITEQQYDLTFEPLTVEGTYVVRYEFLSLDTDRVELALQFDFDRSAPEALPLSGPILIPRDSSNWWQWTLVGGLAVVVLALADRLRRRRRALAELAG